MIYGFATEMKKYYSIKITEWLSRRRQESRKMRDEVFKIKSLLL